MKKPINPSHPKYGKIYKIYSDDSPNHPIYIGGTTQKMLSQRMAVHRYTYKKWIDNKSSSYYSSFEIFFKFGIERCKIKVIENYPCKTKKELGLREQYWIRKLSCVNKILPGRTCKEYYNENKEKILKNQRKYQSENIEKYKAYQKSYYEENREKMLEYQKTYNRKKKLISKVPHKKMFSNV
ncbi:hypothetical protein [Clostridium sp.]|uniref:hypothetical protein n=1 Tax=Clostridium sp. TaxID=1506 RepID=UPI00284CEBCB|nr:hypothetical protein [Clostridium sp.]MDR3598174.1 hypothetical protein [Clostridium sp.]